MVTTLSSREFNQDTSRAKKAAAMGPVVITGRGRPSHVLLSMDHYLALNRMTAGIVELLATPGADDAGFEPTRLCWPVSHADLT